MHSFEEVRCVYLYMTAVPMLLACELPSFLYYSSKVTRERMREPFPCMGYWEVGVILSARTEIYELCIVCSWEKPEGPHDGSFKQKKIRD